MVKAILLDMGGVLVDLDAERCWHNFITRAGFVRIKEFIDPCHQKGFIADLEAGRTSERQFFDECRRYCAPGVTDELIEDCLGTLLGSIDPAKAVYLKELSQRYDLYMLSNNNPVAMRACRRIFEEAGIPMEVIFKDLFISSDMKMSKPGPEIFREAIRRTGHDRSEILFVDDSPRNVKAGEENGLKSVLYVQGTNLRDTIEPALV